MAFEEVVNGRSYSGIPGAAAGNTSTTTLSEDGDNKRGAQVTCYKLPFAPAKFSGTPAEWLNVTNLRASGFSGVNMNGQTLGLPAQPFYSILSWLKYATFGGATTFKGKEAQLWTFSVAQPMSVRQELIADGDTPLRFTENITGTIPGVPGTNSHLYLRYEFQEWHPDGEIPGVWDDFNATDYTNPSACSDNQKKKKNNNDKEETAAAVKNTTMYIFHPANNFNISGQDLGDALGDTLFTCVDVMSNRSTGTDHNYSWITSWNVEHATQVGQYQNCNGYDPASCLGNNNHWVGHEAAMAMGYPTAGQCQDNPLVGEWWSLPVAGRCAASVAPDGSATGCSWQATRTKTIDGECLFKQHGYEAKCREDGRSPFKKAAAAFLAAFASDDVSKGGCPPIKNIVR